LTIISLFSVGHSAPPDPHNCSHECTSSLQNMSTEVPNVLLLSDSIGAEGSGYFTNVVAILGPSASAVTGGGTIGNAKVQHIGGYGTGICGTSYGVVSCMDKWLGQGGWDVIHFNWGLHDICASMYAPVLPEEYYQNMELVYQAMKAALAPNGVLIWSTTTPVPPSYHNRKNTDVVRINQQMTQLFGPNSTHPDVLVSDLYSKVVQRCAHNLTTKGYPQTSDCAFLQSRGVHFSDAGKQFTAVVTSAAIAPVL